MAEVKMKWQIFPGRNRFCCNGRIIMAEQIGIFLVTVFLIIFTNILFFVFDCAYLTVNLSPAIPLIGGVLFVFVMSMLFHTSFMDPGIIPRATADEALYTEREIEVPNGSNGPSYRPPPRTKEVIINGVSIKLKYCFTCKIFRPPRASHCSICDNCVVMNEEKNGQRNFLDSVRENPASVVEAVICFFAVWAILGLAGFHTYLITSNQTTNEEIKGSFLAQRGRDGANPFSYGNFCLNCLGILCGPANPSIIDRRGDVTEQYLATVQSTASVNSLLSVTYSTTQLQQMNNDTGKLNSVDSAIGTAERAQFVADLNGIKKNSGNHVADLEKVNSVHSNTAELVGGLLSSVKKGDISSGSQAYLLEAASSFDLDLDSIEDSSFSQPSHSESSHLGLIHDNCV